MAKKWIIEDGELKLGNVDFHFQLASNRQNVKGGGFWWYDEEKGKMFFYGISTDFGQVSQQDWDTCDKSLSLIHI